MLSLLFHCSWLHWVCCFVIICKIFPGTFSNLKANQITGISGQSENNQTGFGHQFENVSQPGARADFVESESSNPKFNLYDVIQDGPNLKLAKTDDPSVPLEEEPVNSSENESENSEFEIDENFSSNFQAYEEEIHDSFPEVQPESDLELMNALKKKVFDYTGNFQNFETGNFHFFFKIFEILKILKIEKFAQNINFRSLFESYNGGKF